MTGLLAAAVDGIGGTARPGQDAMAEASELVLGGFPLRTDAKVVRYPERYMDERGRPMWEEVCRIMGCEGT